MKFLAIGLLGAALVGAYVVTSVGCSSASSGAACTAYSVPAATDLTTPTVSFAKDVVPIFQKNCEFSGCHNDPANVSPPLFIGTSTAPNTQAYKNLVGVQATEDLHLPYITPGSWQKSYLMFKIDGSQCTINADCTGGDCQLPMPNNLPQLSVSDRDTIRRWIAQGASDN